MTQRLPQEVPCQVPVADLPGETGLLREDLRTERDRHLRTLADFTNFRRRVEREGKTLAEEGIREVLPSLLGVHDVRSFDAVGQPFTPDLHEAVAVQKRPMTEPGTVVEVLRKGYLWKDELFRAAQVQVAK